MIFNTLFYPRQPLQVSQQWLFAIFGNLFFVLLENLLILLVYTFSANRFMLSESASCMNFLPDPAKSGTIECGRGILSPVFTQG